MSVAISRNPSFYSKQGPPRNLQNPPEYACSAQCLERKFIATRDNVPFVDAAKLARTIPPRSPFPREITVNIYKDRLLFQPSQKGPDLPDITYDDIIQLESVPDMRNTVFILTGRRSIGTYAFFKFRDYEVAEQIKDLVRRVNPDAILDSSRRGSSMRLRSGAWQPKSDPRASEYVQYSDSRMHRNTSSPPSVASGDSVEKTPLVRSNSFIRWDGNRQSRSRGEIKQRPNRLPESPILIRRRSRGRESPITLARSSRGRETPSKAARSRRGHESRPVSRSGSRSQSSGDRLEKTIFVKAKGSKKDKRRRSEHKRRPLVFDFVNEKGTYETPVQNRRDQQRSSGGTASKKDRFYTETSKPSKKGKKKKTNTFIINNPSEAITYKPSGRGKSSGRTIVLEGNDSDISLEFDDFQTGRHHYTGAAGRHSKKYEFVAAEDDDDDWESKDSWDDPGTKAAQNGFVRGVSFNLPRRGAGRQFDDDYADDCDESTSEDSLYLENEQYYGKLEQKKPVNYMPELEQRLRHCDVK